MQVNKKAIAVLPFVNMGGNDENDFFCDGITEEIINALSKIEMLKVTSRTSSFYFKDRQATIPEIGKKLGVATVLQGSVRIANSDLRITAQLVSVEEDSTFWSETWDRKIENIFEVQDEISLLIAERLREELGHFEIQNHLVDKQTNSILAYEFSLRAKYYRNKWNPEDVQHAIELSEHALKLDPNHVESYVGLADCYSFLGTTGFILFSEAWEKANYYTQCALKLDDNVSNVYYQIGNRSFFIDCDFETSISQMQQAIRLNPNNAEAQQFLSFLYILVGDTKKSYEHLNIARSINPLSEETQFFTGYYYYMVEDYTRAIDLLNKCLIANDKNIPAHAIKTLCLLKQGHYDEVITYFDSMDQSVIIQGEKTGSIALAYALKKDVEHTKQYEELLVQQAQEPNGFTADSYLFMLYVIKGELEKAFEWIDTALQNKSSLLLLRFCDPLVNRLKAESNYKQYHKKIYGNYKTPTSISKKKALLDARKVKTYTEQLLNYITTHEPFLDENLSLPILANKIDMHPNQLSWLLNESIGKNFNEFINTYRVEAFKERSLQSKYEHITIMGLAYNCGFNSKTVFNTFFKKQTGMTPRQFVKQHSN